MFSREKKGLVTEIKDKKGGGKWSIRCPFLSESRENLVNPWRGWYQIFSFKAEERPDFEELKWCLRAEESLALVRIDIGTFANQDLSEALPNMTDILSFFANAGKGIILRVVYDTAGRGMKREPVRFERVEEHLAALAPLIERFSEEIFVYQGLLVGSWGEMHDSAYLSATHLRRLMGILLGIKVKKCYFAVRTPAQWRQLVGEQEASSEMKSPGKYIGLFDDGMFGSENHLGTFGIKAENEALWEEAWRKEDELLFEKEICRFTPHGGEAVGASGTEKKVIGTNGIVPIENFAGGKDGLPDFKKILERMASMHTVYLNSAYDKWVLDQWREEVWSGKGIWNKTSGYDYIGCRLGYRFVLRKISVHPEKRGRREAVKYGQEESSINAELEIEMENIGFGAFPRLKKSRFALVLEQEGKEVWSERFFVEDYPLPPGGERAKFRFAFPLLGGTLYFKLEALVGKKVCTVYFGNEGYEERGISLGEIRKL